MDLNNIKLKTLFGKELTQLQKEGMTAILNECKQLDNRFTAYILATVFHETGRRMQPVKELGGEEYLKSKKYYPYYGRDLTQTTWKINYERVKRFSGIDVVANPDLIAQMPLAAKVAVTFMVNGWYTSKKLSDYFNEKKSDSINARRIINGTDKAGMIAGYYDVFLNWVENKNM